MLNLPEPDLWSLWISYSVKSSPRNGTVLPSRTTFKPQTNTPHLVLNQDPLFQAVLVQLSDLQSSTASIHTSLNKLNHTAKHRRVNLNWCKSRLSIKSYPCPSVCAAACLCKMCGALIFTLKVSGRLHVCGECFTCFPCLDSAG